MRLQTAGCTNTVRESAPKIESGSKIPCRTGDSNPRQYCAWLVDTTFTQLSHTPPVVAAVQTGIRTRNPDSEPIVLATATPALNG